MQAKITAHANTRDQATTLYRFCSCCCLKVTSCWVVAGQTQEQTAMANEHVAMPTPSRTSHVPTTRMPPFVTRAKIASPIAAMPEPERKARTNHRRKTE